MIETIQLEKEYDTGFRITDINLILEKGEIIGLIGENGCGKTTLIKCLTGIYKPTKGKALCEEKPIYDHSESKEKIAYVSDSQEMLPFYTVKGMKKLFARMYEGFDNDCFEQLKTKLSLQDRQNVNNLSKGQKMALHFALAIARKPEYLVMDEPLSGLDVKKVQIVLDTLIEYMEKENFGVLISSHDLDELETLCDKFVLMKNGRFLTQGSMQELSEKAGKWQAVLDEKQKEKVKGHPRIVWKEALGTQNIFYVRADKNEAEKILQELGIQNAEPLEMSLKELFLLLEGE